MHAEALELQRLMELYCVGDVVAFHRLYATLSPRLLTYLRKMVGDRATAEDLLLTTFLKLHVARSAYVRGANPTPWIYAIAHRTCLDELRKRKRRRVRPTVDGRLPDPALIDSDGTWANVQAPSGSLLADAAIAALEHLPASQRQALLLTKMKGRSHADAAQITGSTPGAIKLRAHRGYVTLRKLLSGR